MENTDKFQVHLTIEDFIELPWRRVHHKICHDADLGIRKTSLCCFCVQFLPDKINFLFLKHCHLPVCQGNQDMPAGWNKEQSGDFLSCSVGGSISADPQMADRACNPWPFHRSEQAGCAKATEWGGYSPSTAMTLFFFPLTSLALFQTYCVRTYICQTCSASRLQQAVTYKPGWIVERAKGHDSVQPELTLVLNDCSI